MSNAKMDLSVIIVCYKGWERLSKCLESLNAFVSGSFSMEVIVVDNNSGDGIINEFENKFKRFRFIRNNLNGGYAYGCNKGAAEASGDFLLILNPDTVVREKEIEKLLANAKSHPEYYIISCRQVSENGKESRAAGRFPALSLRNLFIWKPDNTVSFPDWVSGSLMLTGREIFNRLNGFDESFWMYYEDVDICKRARMAGGEIACYNDIVIEHNHGGSSRINLKTTSITKCEVQISRHLYIHKYFRGLKRFLFQLIVIADNLLTGIIAGAIGLLFFFVPKIFIRFIILLRLIKYYWDSLLRRSWISTRSVITSKASYKS
jgi:hypothetical protein